MKLIEVSGEKDPVKKVQTETGVATLYTDGSMRLYNSGYVQKLTSKQVEQAWSGLKKIDYNEQQLKDLDVDVQRGDLTDAKKREFIKKGLAVSRGIYWDFGDEYHVIPKREKFYK